jgi:hypothetical protein
MYTEFDRKSYKGSGHLGDVGIYWKTVVTYLLEKWDVGSILDSAGSSPVADFCEQRIETVGFIKGNNFLTN